MFGDNYGSNLSEVFYVVEDCYLYINGNKIPITKKGIKV